MVWNYELGWKLYMCIGAIRKWLGIIIDREAANFADEYSNGNVALFVQPSMLSCLYMDYYETCAPWRALLLVYLYFSNFTVVAYRMFANSYILLLLIKFI